MNLETEKASSACNDESPQFILCGGRRSFLKNEFSSEKLLVD